MKVCLLEMDERTRRSVSLVFKHRTNDAITVSDEDSAEIAVIDLDQENSMKAFRSIRERKAGFRAVGLSSTQDVEYEGVFVIRKPIAAGSLLDAIQRMSGKDFQISTMQAAGVASSLSERTRSAKRRTEEPRPSEDSYFDPDAYLMGTLINAAEQARQLQKVAVVRLGGGQVFILDPQSKMIQTNCAKARVLSLFSEGRRAPENMGVADETGLANVEYLSADQIKTLFTGRTYGMPKEQLMWSLGWVTSQGRLPVGVDVDQRLYLQRWPNMTHLTCSADEMRIVSYWIRQPASLREIADALDIPLQEVFSVYTSAFAAGLAGVARRDVDAVWQAPEVTEHQERGLFSSIMKRLLQRKTPANDEVGAEGVVAA